MDRLGALSSLLPPPLPEASRSAPEAARQFEALLVQQMLSALPMEGLAGTQAGTFLSLFHEAMARELVAAGGLGLAEQLQGALSGGSPAQAAPLPPRPRSPEKDAAGPRIRSTFGPRLDPFDGTLRQHRGVDVAASEGAIVRAAAAGSVRFAGEASGYGNLVIVDHGDGLETRYAHCRSLSVRPGERVEAGQALGEVGATGRATGPHLHFEVREHGSAVDPLAHLDSPQHLVQEIRQGVRDGDEPPSEGTP